MEVILPPKNGKPGGGLADRCGLYLLSEATLGDGFSWHRLGGLKKIQTHFWDCKTDL